MKPISKIKSELSSKFKKVKETPASFDFFVAVHDFIKYIELNSVLYDTLSHRIKANRDLDLPAKYIYLKQIYQGLEDVNPKTNADLGHDRYMAVRYLNQIKNNEGSESIPFWKKRELFRNIAVEIYERLDSHLSKSKK